MNATAIVFSRKRWAWIRMRPPVVFIPVIVLGLMLYEGCGGNSSPTSPPPPSQPGSLTYAGSGALFVSDFNGDNKPDLLTSDGTMNIGQGDGTFVIGTPVTIPSGLAVLAVADFDGDTKLDLLVANLCSSTPCSSTTGAVLTGNGDGTFQTGVVVALSAAGLQIIAAADLNGDGKADVVGLFADGTVQVFMNEGGATLASGVPYFSGAGVTSEVVLGDFNGDGHTDIAVSTAGSDQNVQFGGEQNVLLGNGDGTFQSANSCIGPDRPFSAVTADFNRDGNLDLAVADCNLIYGCTVYIFLGVGDGTLQLPPTQLFSGSPPLSGMGAIAVSDINGDGKWDLIIEPNVLVGQIFLGNGDGTFPKTTTFSPSGQSSLTSDWTAIADFNGDGKPDIAVDHKILIGNGDGTFK